MSMHSDRDDAAAEAVIGMLAKLRLAQSKDPTAAASQVGSVREQLNRCRSRRDKVVQALRAAPDSARLADQVLRFDLYGRELLNEGLSAEARTEALAAVQAAAVAVGDDAALDDVLGRQANDALSNVAASLERDRAELFKCLAADRRRGATYEVQRAAAEWERDGRKRDRLPGPVRLVVLAMRARWRTLRPLHRAYLRAGFRRAVPAYLLGTVAVVALALIGWAVWATGDEKAGRGVAAEWLAADAKQVPVLRAHVRAARRGAEPELRAAFDDPQAGAGRKIRAALGLLVFRPAHPDAGPYLAAHLGDASAAELTNVCDALADDPAWAPDLQPDPTTEEGQRFAEAVAAVYLKRANRPADPSLLARRLLASAPQDFAEYLRMLRPAAPFLAVHLYAVLTNQQADGPTRLAAARAVADWADALADVENVVPDLRDAEFRLVYPKVRGSDRAALAQVVVAAEGPAPAAPPVDDGLSPDERWRVYQGRRKAVAAVALIQSGSDRAALDVFRVAADPESLTQFIHLARGYGLSAGAVVRCLRMARDLPRTADRHAERAVFALLLTVAEFGPEEFPPGEFAAVRAEAEALFRDDPSSAIHAAARWVLTRPGWSPQVVTKLEKVESGWDAAGPKEWFRKRVGGQVLTFVVFRPSSKFKLGSPVSEWDRESDEDERDVQLSPFAISATEIGPADLDRLEAATRPPALVPDTIPLYRFWYRAAAVLNAASEADGRTACYRTERREVKTERATDLPGWPLVAGANGYRLPTEAEWEFACRSGCVRTRFSFGSDRALLSEYAWFRFNTPTRTPNPSATRRPNLRGLFDMLGNHAEYVTDWYADEPPDAGPDPVATKPDDSFRVIRGGSVAFRDHLARCAHRDTPIPRNRQDVGFRIVIPLTTRAK